MDGWMPGDGWRVMMTSSCGRKNFPEVSPKHISLCRMMMMKMTMLLSVSPFFLSPSIHPSIHPIGSSGNLFISVLTGGLKELSLEKHGRGCPQCP